MKNSKKLILVMVSIICIVILLVGSIAYYRIVVNGSIKGSTGNAVFVLRDSDNSVWDNKVIDLGKINPGDSGEFTVMMDASGSSVDMYATLEIERTNLPTNLKFYTTSDHKSELHKYYSFLEKDGTNSETLTIYWYWNPYIDDVEDSKFINVSNLEANVRVSAVQISEYAMMKNGSYATYDDETGNEINSISAFWQNTYKTYIRTINFGSDLSNLPSECTEENLCWDISYSSTQKKKVYAYLIDSGLNVQVDVDEKNNPIYQALYNLYIVSEAPIFAPQDCSYLFAGLYNINSINFNDNFNTSKVTNMAYMFGSGYYRSRISNTIQNLDLSGFNTSNVTDMNCMFLGYMGLLNLDIGNFNTSKVTDMSGMFSACSSLTSLDVSSFNTAKVTSFGSESLNFGMFNVCSSLMTLDLSSFDTSSAINMYAMLYSCSSLTSLNLSGFNTANVTTMAYMFSNCSSLTNIDLSNFNTVNVTDMKYMFSDCSSLTNLDLSNFNTSKVTNMEYMFSSCSSLVSLDLSSLKEFTYRNAGASKGITILQDCSSLENLNLRSLTIFSNCDALYDLNNLRYLDISSLYLTDGVHLPDSDKLVTTINYIGTYSVYDSKLQKYVPSFYIGRHPSQGRITINYEAAAEPFLDQIISEHPEYNWVKGKLITRPSTN